LSVGDAEKAALALYEREGAGHFTKERILEVAQDAKDPLSPPLFEYLFNHDDAEAALRWRLHRAAELVRRIKVTRLDGDEELKVRAFHPMARVGRAEPGFVHIDDITPEEHPYLLRNMQLDIARMKRAYGHLAQFWQGIQDMLEERRPA
jgi:hypothetical protein